MSTKITVEINWGQLKILVALLITNHILCLSMSVLSDRITNFYVYKDQLSLHKERKAVRKGMYVINHLSLGEVCLG